MTHDPEVSDSKDEFRLLRHCGRDGGSGWIRQLLEEIVGSQHHRSFSLDWPFEELTRCSLLNRIAQPHKLIYSLICLHIMLALLSHPTLWSGSTAESRPEESPDRSKSIATGSLAGKVCSRASSSNLSRCSALDCRFNGEFLLCDPMISSSRTEVCPRMRKCVACPTAAPVLSFTPVAITMAPLSCRSLLNVS